MVNWFDDVIREKINEDYNNSDDRNVTVEISVSASKVDELKQALASINCGVKDVVVKEAELPKYEDNIGKRASVNYNLVIASDLLMKTQYSLYKIEKVILPKGYIGIISGYNDGKYEVSFDANLPIKKEDIVEGYDGVDLTYLLDKFNLSPSEISIM